MTIDELVRDLTKVHPRPKSQVRRMITEAFIDLITSQSLHKPTHLSDPRQWIIYYQGQLQARNQLIDSLKNDQLASREKIETQA